MSEKTIIKGKPLNFNIGLQKWYVKELTKLVDDLTKEVLKEVKPLYKEYKEQITFTQDASISSQMRILLNSLKDKFYSKFKEKGKKFANKMVRKTNRYATTTFNAIMRNLFDKDKVKHSPLRPLHPAHIQMSLL